MTEAETKTARFNLSAPLIYLITSNLTDAATESSDVEFQNIIKTVERAVHAGVSLIQLREKSLRPRVLFELTRRAVEIAEGSHTKILVNDRVDVALAAGAAGAHLTTLSLSAKTVRTITPPEFLIGVSAHSIEEVASAKDGAADFVTFSPIFATPSKAAYGAPRGLAELQIVAQQFNGFPVIALGGITDIKHAGSALEAGASGVAAIRLFAQAHDMTETVAQLRGVAK